MPNAKVKFASFKNPDQSVIEEKFSKFIKNFVHVSEIIFIIFILCCTLIILTQFAMRAYYN